MSRDHHATPFDEGTLTKLALYRAYIEAWLPTFVGDKTPYIHTINIFDFFAGPGQDLKGEMGSPMIALEVIEAQKGLLTSKGRSVGLYLNEFDPRKKNLLDSMLAVSPSQGHVSIQTESLEFGTVFEKWFPLMNAHGAANFLFLDQSGVKHITPEVFRRIIQIKTTDFMFFIASSVFRRFPEQPEISGILNIPQDEVKRRGPYEVHRLLVDFYRDLVPKGMEIYLAGFSIKKGSNIYGLIFGSRHVRGIEKFLRTAWGKDRIRGEADFDIDREGIDSFQKRLFQELDVPQKLIDFENELTEKVIAGELSTNRSVFLFSLERGFLPAKHAKSCLKRLKDEGRLPEQQLSLSYGEAWNKTPKPIILKDNDHG